MLQSEAYISTAVDDVTGVEMTGVDGLGGKKCANEYGMQ